MSLTIIVCSIFGTRDGHRHVNGINLQLTVHNAESHLIEVRVRVLEVAGQDTHVVSASFRLGHGPCGGLSDLNRSRHVIQLSA